MARASATDDSFAEVAARTRDRFATASASDAGPGFSNGVMFNEWVILRGPATYAHVAGRAGCVGVSRASRTPVGHHADFAALREMRMRSTASTWCGRSCLHL